MSGLLNRKGTKAFILAKFKAMRAGAPMTRVASDYLEELEGYIRARIIRDIQSHPSIGKTFKP